MAYNWYKAFYERKVLPGLLKEMQSCSGRLPGDQGNFYTWLHEADRPLYDEISLEDEKINALWMEGGDKERFKEACRAWVLAHFRAKSRYLTALSAGPIQESLI